MDRDKKIVGIYLILTIAVNIFFSGIIILDGRGLEENIIATLILMFSPAILALIINPLFQQNLITEYIISESGIALVLSSVILGFIYFRKENELKTNL